ncbi:MAG: ribosome silencing factor [Bacteroidia bacterium]|nr:ribosome silencing factor [Bacteroidia bacterium]
MAKKPLKKAKATKTAKSKTVTSKKTSGKISAAGGNKKTIGAKKVITEKERALREANAIANSEKKKLSNKRPKKTSTPKQTTSLLDAIVDGMQEKKAKNIMILDLTEIENRVTDYFVISDADSNVHVNSIADSVEEVVEKTTKERAYHTEGRQNGEWILIDYINVVAHVFLLEMREHYNVEGLWGDAKITLVN